jgi:hypothetical protein
MSFRCIGVPFSGGPCDHPLDDPCTGITDECQIADNGSSIEQLAQFLINMDALSIKTTFCPHRVNKR